MDKNIVAAFLGAYNMAIRGELGKRLRDTMPPERKQELIRYIVEDKPATKQQKEPLASCWKLCLKVRFSQVLLTYAKRLGWRNPMKKMKLMC